MAPVLTLALIIFIFYRIFTSTERKFDKRLPPFGMKVDHGTMNHDLAMGKSKNEVMQKCNDGKYDILCDKDDPLYKYRQK